MDPSKTDCPPLKDLTADNITENTVRINSQCPDARMRYVMDRLVTHLHDFALETRLSTHEWKAGIEFLTATGNACTGFRQEMVLLSDILGLSVLVDCIDHPKPPTSTEGSLIGPFHTHDAEEISHGQSMSRDPQGEPCLVLCTVKDTQGKPIEGAKVDIWEADSTGRYDVQYPDRDGPDGRCFMASNADGSFWFKSIKPTPYPIPCDGPVALLLRKLHRHPYRPAHIHFMFDKPGYDHLTTALYMRNDPYETSDAVFGVKESLIVDFHPADDSTAEKYEVARGSPVLRYDFVLASDQEASDLRGERSKQALDALGRTVRIVDGLPVPDVDVD